MAGAENDSSVAAFFDKLFSGLRSIPTKSGRVLAYFFAGLIALTYAGGVVLPLFFEAKWAGLIGLATIGYYFFDRLIKQGESPGPVPNIALLPGPGSVELEKGGSLRTWGRQEDLDLLISWIKRTRVAAVLLWGPPAVGKTSLVSAGLQSELTSRLPGYEYIETDASQDFEDDLVEKLREKNKKLKSHSIDSILASDRGSKQVVVLDDASLADGIRTKRLIEIVKKAIDKKYPYNRVLIVIIDEVEFRELWEKEKWRPRSGKEGLRFLPLQRLRQNDALDIALDWKKTASFHVDDEVLAIAIEDLAQASPQPPGISPLVLLKVVNVMAREAGSGPSFGVDDYRSSGGVSGLMAAYLLDKLDVEAPGSGRILLIEINQIINSSSNFTISAFGSQVGSAGYKAAEDVLRVLSSPELRVLRYNAETGECRIIEEWRSALAVAAAGREPEVIAAERSLKVRFSEWNNHRREGSIFKRYGKARYLLTNNELRQLGKRDGKLSLNSGLRSFKKLSREYRGGQRALLVVLTLASISVGTRIWAAVDHWVKGEVVGGAGIPSDVSRYGKNIKHIALDSNCMVTDLAWLPPNLEALDAACSRVESLDGVPPKLRRLNLGSSAITSLRGLPKSVTDLNVSSTHLGDGLLRLVGTSVTSLDVSGIRIYDLSLLPRTLESLALSHADINNLRGLPEGLNELNLVGTSVKSLRDLPSSITKLRLNRNSMDALDYLPPHLDSLDTDLPMVRGMSLPESLRTLSIRKRSFSLPEGITSLEISAGARLESVLPRGLERLWINSSMPSADLSELPPGLKRLKFVWPQGSHFDDLPTGLEVLDLSWSTSVSDVSGIRSSIRSLTLTKTAVKDFRHIPDFVTELIDQHCEMRELKEFPKALKHLDLSGCSNLERVDNLPPTLETLDLSGTKVTKLPHPLPPSLAELNISKTGIGGKLPDLPKKLVKLTIKFGQFKSIKNLPASVQDLVFVGADGEVPKEDR